MELTEKEIIRTQETLKLMPKDVVSILDIGCGGGRVTNDIRPEYKIIGLDICLAYIKEFLGPKLIADASRLPFKNSQFDLVLATEMLEHIPEENFKRTVSEIFRVSKRYIIITVPFQQTISARWLKCAKCGYIFHIWKHLRRFDFSMLKKLSPEGHIIRHNLFGPEIAQPPSFLCMISKKIGNAWYRTEGDLIFASRNVCPRCKAQLAAIKPNFLGRILTAVIRRLERIKLLQYSCWIGCLYEKEAGS